VTEFPSNPLEPAAVRVNLRAARVGSLVLTVLLCGGLTAAAIYGAVDADDTATRVIAIVIAVGFSIPLWMVVLLLANGVLAPSGIAFDSRGLHYWRGSASSFLSWPEVAGIGIGFETPPSTPSVATSVEDVIKGYLEDKIKDAVKLRDLRKVALEIYPVDTGLAERHPELSRYWREYPSQFPPLPSARWRLPLPPMTGVARTVTRAINTHQPQRSLGWFKRPWTGGLFGAGKGRD
jgi:hypothetical protein